MNDALKQDLESTFKDVLVTPAGKDRITVTVKDKAVLTVLQFLKDRGFRHLALVSCVDWIADGEFELVYILSSYISRDNGYTEKERTNITVKTRISRDKAHFSTSMPVFKNAEPYEREIHELFGIDFEGHPRQTPLLLERKYAIPPFRKDFDTRKYVKDVFDKVPFVEGGNEKP